MTPLHYAVSKCREDIARLLIAKGADVKLKDKNNRTSMDYITGCGPSFLK
jgi:ankyrin repeat protein